MGYHPTLLGAQSFRPPDNRTNSKNVDAAYQQLRGSLSDPLFRQGDHSLREFIYAIIRYDGV